MNSISLIDTESLNNPYILVSVFLNSCMEIELTCHTIYNFEGHSSVVVSVLAVVRHHHSILEHHLRKPPYH